MAICESCGYEPEPGDDDPLFNGGCVACWDFYWNFETTPQPEQENDNG